jgi:hypothetical protein
MSVATKSTKNLVLNLNDESKDNWVIRPEDIVETIQIFNQASKR